MSDLLAHVHETTETVASIELTPPHDKRVETPEYRQAHHLLVIEKDSPCFICGVRRSDLLDSARRGDRRINPYGATEQESHHYPVERSLADAVDWRKVHARYPAVYSQASFDLWVDSPENLVVLCDVHHRSLDYGIHHLLTQDFAILPFLKDGYQIAASARDAAAALAHDAGLVSGPPAPAAPTEAQKDPAAA